MDNLKKLPTTWDQMLDFLEAVLAQILGLADQIARVGESAEQFEQKILELIDQVPGARSLPFPSAVRPGHPAPSVRRPTRCTRQRLRATGGELPIRYLTKKRLADGGWEVSIEGKPLSLPSVLGNLLDIISSGQPPDGEGCVPFLPIQAIVHAMRDREGRNYGERAVRQAVYRLRLALAKSGLSPSLVQTGHDGAVRLLWRP
jgi:hypothetical protein